MRYYKRAKDGVRVKKSGDEWPPYTYDSGLLYSTLGEAFDSSAPEGTRYSLLDDSMHAPEGVVLNDIRYITSASERIKRQLFKETGGEKNPDKAVSPAGAKGRWQIMPATQKDLEDRDLIPKNLDPFDPNDSKIMRDAKIRSILKLNFISDTPKPIPEVNKLARVYASYNWGEGNTRKALEKAKSEGVDIYGDPRLWLDYLPEETHNYVKYILFDE